MLFRGAFGAGAEFLRALLLVFLGAETWRVLPCLCVLPCLRTGTVTRWVGCRALLLPAFFLTFTCRVCPLGAATTRGCSLVLLTVFPVCGDRLGALACAAERCLVTLPVWYDLDCRLVAIPFELRACLLSTVLFCDWRLPDLSAWDGCRLLRFAEVLVFDGCTEAMFVGLSVLPTPPSFDLRFDLRPALL